MFILEKETKMTADVLKTLINEHRAEISRYDSLMAMYTSDHPILHDETKPEYKPDNRIVANHAKYIVDTFNGYFIGIPAKASHDDEAVNAYIQKVGAYNHIDDHNAELAKGSSVMGHYFELLFQDEDSEIGITRFAPTEGFMVYDDSLLRRPMFAVRYYSAEEGYEGSFSDSSTIQYFTYVEGEISFGEEVAHYFGGVPVVEYVENEELQAVFEPVLTMINAYNKAVSEKANDVDYYADSYLKILGAEIAHDSLEFIRANRIINFPGQDTAGITVDFLGKPDADGTQEHLIDRLRNDIFHLSMVANISDESFGSSSGIALAYKLLSMDNLAISKERKFTAAFQRRWQLIAQNPASKMSAEDWTGVTFTFTRNSPKNMLEESQVAMNLMGVESHETVLELLSNVSDAEAEMVKIQTENATTNNADAQGGARSMYAITSVLSKYKSGVLTFENALTSLLMLGLSEAEARKYLNGGVEEAMEDVNETKEEPIQATEKTMP